MTHPLRVLIADDEALLRAGLKALLTSSPDMDVVGEAENGHEALALVRELRPHVVLMDLCMRALGGFEALSRILVEAPGTRVLMVSGLADVRHVARALALGSSGYLLKTASAAELLHAIREVASGRRYLHPTVPSHQAAQLEQQLRANGTAKSTLTDRQREVLQLVAKGKASKEIAADLGLSTKTVDAHRSQVMARLGVHDIAGLVQYAIAEGLVPQSR